MNPANRVCIAVTGLPASGKSTIGREVGSGTLTRWLGESFAHVIELYCVCPLEVAARRFSQRQRHGGHLDAAKSPAEIMAWLQAYRLSLPLSLGTLLEIDTQPRPALDVMMHRLSKILLALD